ncbi:MAG: YigZ family protein [Candidatus Latescibacterota bacterium]|nr:YigZ family protein [Candidatus Latescibacterota bacterium]
MLGYPIAVGEAEVELRFKNSRFIGCVGQAKSVEEAKAFIAVVRDRYPDASHHCYAFAAGYGATVTHGMSDDGEPSGTAGRPMLAVVQGADIGDVVVVATRYFGGTKLGTGGLVKAYTETAQAALAAVPVERKVETELLSINLGYDSYAPCRKRIEELGGLVENEAFETSVVLQVRAEIKIVDDMRRALADMTAGRALVEKIS